MSSQIRIEDEGAQLTERIKVDIPFAKSEADAFRAFIEDGCRGYGKWVRKAILQAMQKEKARNRRSA